MDPRNTDALRQRMNRRFEVFGTLLTDGFHYVALLAIGGAIFWSASVAFLGMVQRGYASIEDPVAPHLSGAGGHGGHLFPDEPHAGAVPDLRGSTG
jgi:phosphate starvation-inducible membrane PsiE